MGKIDEHICKLLQSHKDELNERFQVESLSIFGSVKQRHRQARQ